MYRKLGYFGVGKIWRFCPKMFFYFGMFNFGTLAFRRDWFWRLCLRCNNVKMWHTQSRHI